MFTPLRKWFAPSPLNQPATALGRGAWGEEQAEAYLVARGWRVVARNWRCKLGEIDLIMDDRRDNTRVFVEVKLRQPTQFGGGADVIANQKQRKLIKTAKYYQVNQGYWGNVRFDAIIITVQAEQKPKIEHIENAFEAS